MTNVTSIVTAQVSLRQAHTDAVLDCVVVKATEGQMQSALLEALLAKLSSGEWLLEIGDKITIDKVTPW